MKSSLLHHPRLLTSLGLGIAIYFLLPGQWPLLTRVLVCWNTGVGLFLILIYSWLTQLSAEQICIQYTDEDESAPVILVLVILAACASLLAITVPLATLKQVAGAERTAHLALAAFTLVNSWILVPTMFTVHYADLFYSEKKEARPLRFPETPMPVFWDFAYFSFTIAAACQTSDVTTTRSKVRKVVIVHTIISFVFNASILGFAINVTAGLLGGN